jgi:hypothetical protein
LIKLSVTIIFCWLLLQTQSFADEKRVTIIEPKNRATVKSPVKVCMSVENLSVEPAKMGVNEGKGHHHILFTSLPTDLSMPLGKKSIIHMGNGKACQTIELASGQHGLTTLFAYGNHVPYNPPVYDKILIRVEKEQSEWFR